MTLLNILFKRGGKHIFYMLLTDDKKILWRKIY